MVALTSPHDFFLPSLHRPVRGLVRVQRPPRGALHAQELAAGLRIDIAHPEDSLGAELEGIWRRLSRPGDALFGIARLGIDYQGLVFRYREADGEHYVYVEDPAHRCVAGYTVFNRLIELDRRADLLLRAPHSKFAAPYQRRGIASTIYRWWLDHGRCLISGARQSAGAHAQWHALAREYELSYVDLGDRTLSWLGPCVDGAQRDRLQTRMLMLGKGRTRDWLARYGNMQLPALSDAGDTA